MATQLVRLFVFVRFHGPGRNATDNNTNDNNNFGIGKNGPYPMRPGTNTSVMGTLTPTFIRIHIHTYALIVIYKLGVRVPSRKYFFLGA